ncbi:hypothetical protein [Embleya sp. AB8]|uniref:hypothetical protein n=1 Tax=Embleya sp. AB8 TaxID=3156304 RepID=UPI003C78E0C7
MDITGDGEAGRRVHAVLRAAGLVAEDAEPDFVPFPDDPAVVTMSVLCHCDGAAG